MSSILTNNGAMVALQTLKSINSNLSQTQSAIATGKDVANSKDNAAVWAISKVMESDVAGFKAISSNLGLGQATTQVARQAAETTTDLLKQMKEKIVASQEQNVDRAKIQTDIDALTDQIASVTGAAQFNGLNMLSNTSKTAGSGTTNVLSSLDRSSTGVTASDISIQKQDLGTGVSSIGTAAVVVTADNQITGFGDAVAAALTGGATAPTGTTTIGTAADTAIVAGRGFNVTISGSATAAGSTVEGAPNTTSVDDIKYVARDGDTAEDVANGLAQAFNDYISENMTEEERGTIAAVADGNTVVFTGQEGTGNNFSVAVNAYNEADTTIGGGLEALATMDVTTDAGAAKALESIEGLIQKGIDAAATFGSSQKRIETQQDFVGGLMDAMKSGIGTLVDADMEEQSARLQALQVQQQLGVQALSIANQAPQQLLSLFR